MRHRWFAALLLIGVLLTGLGLGVAAAADPCACPQQTCDGATCATTGPACGAGQCQRGDSLSPAERDTWSGAALAWVGPAPGGDPPAWRLSPALRPPQA